MLGAASGGGETSKVLVGSGTVMAVRCMDDWSSMRRRSGPGKLLSRKTKTIRILPLQKSLTQNIYDKCKMCLAEPQMIVAL